MGTLAPEEHTGSAEPGNSPGGHAPSNPFPGPRPFLTDEQALFFGRDREVRDLVALIHAQRVVLVHGPSGTGKSSLVQAGVVPAAGERGFEVLPVARLRCEGSGAGRALQPDQNRFVCNVIENWRARDDFRGHDDATTLASFFNFPIDLESERAPRGRVVIFDQFEELFVLHPERWRDREEFFGQLQESLDVHPSLRVLLLVRDDYLAHLEPLAHRLRDGLRIRYHLRDLTAEQALAAMIEPVARAGRTFEPGAAEELAAELLRASAGTADGSVYDAEHVDALQLQIVMRTLWDKLPAGANQITKDLVREHGNVDRALLDFYDESVATAAKACKLGEQQVRQWCEEKLITPARSRALVFQDQTTTAGLKNEAIAVLEGRRLIRSEPRGQALWFELTHDRLIAAVLDSNRSWLTQLPRRRWRSGAALLLGVAAIVIAVTLSVNSRGDGQPAPLSTLEKQGTLERGQEETIPFEGRQGQLAMVQLEGRGHGGLTARLLVESASGERLAEAVAPRWETAYATSRLPADGSYSARVVALDDSSGEFTVRIILQTVDRYRTLSTRSVTGSISEPELEADIYAIRGGAGEVLSVSIHAEEFDSLMLMVRSPSGRTWLNDGGGASEGDPLLLMTLPEDGTYEIVASPSSDSGSRYELSVERPRPQELRPGVVEGRLSGPGSSVLYTVRHLSGPFALRVTTSPEFETRISLYDQDGEVDPAGWSDGESTSLLAVANRDTAYLLMVTALSGPAGTFEAELREPNPVELRRGVEAPASGRLEPGEVADVVAFDGQAREVVTLIVSPRDRSNLAVIVYGPNGIVLDHRNETGDAGEEFSTIRLEEGGRYYAFVSVFLAEALEPGSVREAVEYDAGMAVTRGLKAAKQ